MLASSGLSPAPPFLDPDWDGAQRGLRWLSLISVPCPLSTGTWCYDSQDPKCGEDRVSCEAVWDVFVL